MNPQLLDRLRDIHPPPAPPFWPPAPGWWLAALLLLIVLLLLGRSLFRAYRQRRLRRQVLAELARLDTGYRSAAATEFAAAVSRLLRRVALRRYPRKRVAGLVGDAWLRFLDQTGGGGGFCQGPGRVLADGPYRPRTEVDTEALLALARRWIGANLGVRHDP